MADGATKAPPAWLRAFRHRNYQLFFVGQSISLIGTWMQQVGESWLMYRLTHSSSLLGLVGFSNQIPVFLLAAFGGALADRHNRRAILLTTQSCAMLLAAALAAITFIGVVQPWHLFAIAALLGISNAFDIPTRQAFVADIVGRQDLMNAIAMNSSLVNGARIVGPAIAGLLVASVGEAWCFSLNSASYIAAIIAISLMKLPPHVPRADSSMRDNIREGFGFVWRNRPVRSLLALLGIVSLLGMPYAVLMPIFAEDVLHAGSRGLGILMGSSGCGALTGALVLAQRRELRGLGRWVVRATALFGTALIAFSYSRQFWLSCVLMVFAGFGFMIQMASSNTLIQSMVPDELRGRVMSVYSMMFMGMAPLGALLAGTIAEGLGAPRTVALGGALCVVASFGFHFRFKQLRCEAHALLFAQQMIGGQPAEDVAGALPDSSRNAH